MWNGNKVHMIGHETPDENGRSMAGNFLSKHSEILQPIDLLMEHVHGTNAALRYMVRIHGHYDAS